MQSLSASAVNDGSSAASSYSSAAAISSVSSYHRGDPLDIPLIDDHLLTKLLLPRIVSAIKLAFPQVYLDWTTGTTTTIATSTSEGDEPNNNNYSYRDDDTKTTLVWKRILEGLLRACLVVGSCHRIISYNNGNRHGNNKSNSNDVLHIVATPAMKSLGMVLRPTSTRMFGGGHQNQNNTPNTTTTKSSSNNYNISSRIQAYGKILSLVFTTVVVPSLYRELKHRRMTQLEERERRLRLEDIRREIGHSSSSDTFLHQLQQQQQNPTTSSALAGSNTTDSTSATSAAIIQLRAQQRKSNLQTLLSDTILGLGDVLLPPLQLISYISYLWGMSSTPWVGMMLSGWEYSAHDGSVGGTSMNDNSNHVNNNNEGGRQQQRHNHQRHANFQYGNRRLLVEEALRTVSMVLPPRNTAAVEGGTGGTTTTTTAPAAANGVGNGYATTTPVRSSIIGGGASSSSASSLGTNPRILRRRGDNIPATGSRSFMGRRSANVEENHQQVLHGGTLSSATSMAQRTVGNKQGWVRRRFLSFMGVVDEDDDADDNSAELQDEGEGSDARRYSLTCSMCHVENPTIPYTASCGHCYCYLCLRMAVTDDLSFQCVDCGRTIMTSGRPKLVSKRSSS